MPSILIADDAPNIRALARLYFEQEGFAVRDAQDGAEALRQLQSEPPDLLLLDLMMPQVDGWELCRRLRAQGNTLPIIVLTARDEDVDKIVGLEIGADDYVTKPFNPRELVARARALLRRRHWEQRPAEGSAPLSVGTLHVDRGGRSAAVAGQPLLLRPREWELLAALVQGTGQVLSRERLLDEVWGYEFHGDTRTVDVHIAALREKLRAAKATDVAIETVWGIGYKLVEVS